ncbi:MAG: FHA domain-containing protein [Candidatus Promineifilaceae bacterium]|nr:FHA domain-containing protein [Candidatus Promineifilaceae bacterium]
MSDQPVLIMREGELTNQQWTITTDEFLIGRGGDCQLVLPERQVSRHHAKILRQDGSFILQDLDSKNGTYINGRQLKGKAVLYDGDEIQIALAVKLQFVGTGATLPLTFDPPKPERALEINEAERSVSIKGKLLNPPLSLAQFRLLKLLEDADGAVCSRDKIVEVVWPGTEGIGVSEQAIDALVRRLRDRLAELDSHNYVVTVRGHGFKMDNQIRF